MPCQKKAVSVLSPRTLQYWQEIIPMTADNNTGGSSSMQFRKAGSEFNHFNWKNSMWTQIPIDSCVSEGNIRTIFSTSHTSAYLYQSQNDE